MNAIYFRIHAKFCVAYLMHGLCHSWVQLEVVTAWNGRVPRGRRQSAPCPGSGSNPPPPPHPSPHPSPHTQPRRGWAGRGRSVLTDLGPGATAMYLTFYIEAGQRAEMDPPPPPSPLALHPPRPHTPPMSWSGNRELGFLKVHSGLKEGNTTVDE